MINIDTDDRLLNFNEKACLVCAIRGCTKMPQRHGEAIDYSVFHLSENGSSAVEVQNLTTTEIPSVPMV